MKGRVVFGGAFLCIFALLDFGTTHHLKRATDSNENEVETILVSENVNLNSDEVITATEIKTEVGEAHGHKYIKKTKVISTIVYFGGNLDERFIGETEESFIIRVFTQSYDEDDETFISRVFNKYDDETVAGYIRRIETFRRLNPDFIAFDNVEYLELTKTYYALTLVKFDFETVEEYYDRILRKRSYETIESYIKRIAITRALLPDSLVWKGFVIDFTSEKGYLSPYTSTVIITKRNVLPIRLPAETEEDYCTRTFAQTISETIETYFTRLFDFYEDETVTQYVLRIETIRQLYSDLNIWDDVTYVRFTRPYFQVEYTRLDIETVQEYYQRVLNIQAGECFEAYEKRITILYEVYPELDVWKNFVFDLTSTTGYIITTTSAPSFPKTKIDIIPVVSDTTIRVTRSLPEVVELTKEETIRITYQQQTSESEDDYFRRITQVNVGEDDASYMDRLTIIMKYYPHLTLWYDVKYLTYIENFYTMYYSQDVDEEISVYYERVLKREIYETDEEYENKITLVRSLFPSLPVWYSYDYVVYTKSFYTITYTQRTTETIEQYYERLFTQLPYEDDVLYYKRLIVVRNLYPSLSAWYDVKYLTYSERFYKLYYSQDVDEVLDVYYDRVLRREIYETDEEYEYKITLVRSLFPSLAVWYSPDYVAYTKSFYTITYTQRTTETIEQYYERLFTQLPFEDDVLYYKRLIVVRNLYPSLSAWYDVKYLTYSERFYKLYYSQDVDEVLDVYYDRVLRREIYETDEEYEYKITLVRSLFPSLAVWYSPDYVTYTKSFYTITYTQRTTETIEQYYERLFTQLPFEDDVLYYKRLIVVRNLYPSLSAWYDVKYLTYSERFYKLYYSQDVDEVVDVYYDRVLRREIYETDEEYEYKITLVRSLFPSLAVWYSPDYVAYTKSFYTITYTQRTTETIEQYYERLFTQLPYEDDVLYYKRLIVVRNLYPSLSAWYDVKYLIYSERFYKLYYSQEVDEVVDVYYDRVLRREIYETDEEYEYKITLVRSLFPSLAVWYSPDYVTYTKSFYTITYTQRTTETIEQYYERLFTQLPYEDDVLYYKRLIVVRNLYPSLSAWYDVKYLTYSERFYKLYYSQEVDEVLDVYYDRVLRREIYETDEEYEYKITLVRSLFPSLAVWYSSDYITYTKSFYTITYTQRTTETIEQYYERLFTQLPYEDDVLYYKRLIVVRNLYPSLSAWYDVKYLTYSEKFYKLYYSQEVDEVVDVYYARVLKREVYETDEEYENKILIARSLFPSLAVWYSPDYFVYTKSFYTITYTQRTTETSEQYYERLFTQLPYEDDVLYYKRIIVIRNLFSSLPVWNDVAYLLYTERFYKLYYSQQADEVEADYLNRLFKRYDNEVDSEYFTRIQFIETACPNLTVWLNRKYLTYTEDYYRILFGKKSTESVKQWRARLRGLNTVYTPKKYSRSLKIIKALFPDFASKVSKTQETVYRKKFNNAIKFVKNLRKQDSSSSSSSFSKLNVGSSSSSSED